MVYPLLLCMFENVHKVNFKIKIKLNYICKINIERDLEFAKESYPVFIIFHPRLLQAHVFD